MPGLIFAVLVIIALWRVFSKAGKPGWYAIIPILNVYTLVKIAGKPGWWTILFFIPIANLIASLLVSIDLAKAFGKSTAFGIVALWLFSIVGYFILGFGSAKYQGADSAAV
ncbi:hypothetical protein EYE40_08525 [Glaciihabitans arcticus]|uniref:Signal peptidase I n=1 Tax=Glaciihabitans arcticus TaxID=2668039 RepID=A0A4Q9GU42_9MICO|nr:hypothetical protein EYE40_08525 [Glaciihabitans arcticus]